MRRLSDQKFAKSEMFVNLCNNGGGGYSLRLTIIFLRCDYIVCPHSFFSHQGRITPPPPPPRTHAHTTTAAIVLTPYRYAADFGLTRRRKARSVKKGRTEAAARRHGGTW